MVVLGCHRLFVTVTLSCPNILERQDVRRIASERSKYTSLYESIELVEFSKDLALLYEVLKESSILKRQSLHRYSSRQINKFQLTMKAKPGEKEFETTNVESKMEFKGKKLKDKKYPQKIIKDSQERALSLDKDKCLQDTKVISY